ncbi:MAG TPA: hypothetical protein VF587_06155 [Solirubrobacteraceae bacterium]|jgi:hypothetical protein
MHFGDFPGPDDDVPEDAHAEAGEEHVEEHSMDEFPEGFEHFRFRAKPSREHAEPEEDHSMDEFPDGFEHFKFRATPEIAQALQKMTLLRDD